MEPLGMDDGIVNAVEGLKRHGSRFATWRTGFSGGKDSTALVTLVAWLVESGQIEAPDRSFVMIADTLQELPPLIENAERVAEMCEQRMGWTVVWLRPPLERSFLFQLLGRGLFTPGVNGHMRWCTRMLKTEPMTHKRGWVKDHDVDIWDSLLLYGSRIDESDSRAQSMAKSCTLEGSECGTGVYLESEGPSFSPLARWRNCAVWDWLHLAKRRIGFDARMLHTLYGKAEAADVLANPDHATPEEVSEAIDATTRTGCIGCPLVADDFALKRIVEWPQWRQLKPFLALHGLYRELREHHHRLRKLPGERNKKGELVKNQCRVGPICLPSRRWALQKIWDWQMESYDIADELGLPRYTLLSHELKQLIEDAIDAGTFPERWDGTEPLATDPNAKFADVRKHETQKHLFGGV